MIQNFAHPVLFFFHAEKINFHAEKNIFYAEKIKLSGFLMYRKSIVPKTILIYWYCFYITNACFGGENSID